MNAEKVITGLSPLQADGLACVECGADYLRIRAPHVPVSRPVTGSHCCCPDKVQRAGGGVLR
ncbi:hypothetical protein GCM10012275_02040 [Longimycelium tulufanense]|uniref:Uncharacterized protein n=1 Tax=Longimycelium tulufanense TaxID=907463 RepID=A0A8J3CBC7_9PSEU|nr:hypothetical protein GCM10012275_02040 [Longimycelium tulufanense]